MATPHPYATQIQGLRMLISSPKVQVVQVAIVAAQDFAWQTVTLVTHFFLVGAVHQAIVLRQVIVYLIKAITSNLFYNISLF